MVDAPCDQLDGDDGFLRSQVPGPSHNHDGEPCSSTVWVSRSWSEQGKHLVEISQKDRTHLTTNCRDGAAIVELPSRRDT